MIVSIAEESHSFYSQKNIFAFALSEKGEKQNKIYSKYTIMNVFSFTNEQRTTTTKYIYLFITAK